MIFFKKIIILLLLIDTSIFAKENEYLDLVEAIERLCGAPKKESSTFYTTKLNGKASIDVKIIGLADGEASFSKKEWNGVQRVLQQEQLKDNKSYRSCSLSLTPLFIEGMKKKEKAKQLAKEKAEKLAKEKAKQLAKEKAKRNSKPKIWSNNYYKYVFYGRKSSNTRWAERYFKVLHRNGTMPKVGDILYATNSINIRSNYIKYKQGKWRNSSIIGSIEKGNKLKVIEVKEVDPNFIWIKFH